MKTYFLSNQDVNDLISVTECIGVIEKLFTNIQKTKMPPKVYMKIPDGDFRSMPAIVDNTAGFKWCGVHLDGTKKKRKCNIFAKVLINQVDTGELLAIMDGESITAIRTAAVTGVATKYMARQDSKVAAFIGCGNQTRSQVEAVCHVLDIEQVRLFDLDEDRCRQVAVSLIMDGVDVVPCTDLIDCVKEADVITTLTPSRTGFLKHEWLKDKVHINAVGADAEGKRELSPCVLENVDLVVYDNWEQCSHSGEIQYTPYYEKKQDWFQLADIVSGKLPTEGNQTLFDATGLAIEDVATARYIYDKKENLLRI